jgi:hypothetical protein
MKLKGRATRKNNMGQMSSNFGEEEKRKEEF